MKKNWFRNETWNDEIAYEFEKKLKNAKSNSMKSQYLRIQAVYLLNHTDSKINEQGLNMLYRILQEFSEETLNVMFAHGILGDYYYEKSVLREAEKHYQIIYEHNIKNKNNRYLTPELRLSEIYLASNDENEWIKALKLLNEMEPKTLFFNIEKFHYYVIFALINNKLNMKEAAVQSARIALDIAQTMNMKGEEYPHDKISFLNYIIKTP